MAAAVVLVLVAGGVAAVMLTGNGGDGSGAGTSAPPPARAAKGSSCDRKAATPAVLDQELVDAKAGDTICLAAGNYGTFRGAVKPGPVTIRAKRGAKARMVLDFDGVANLRIEDVTIPSATIRGPTRNLTIADSRFTGIALVNTDAMRRANVVFDGNTHSDIDTCLSCLQGRVNVVGDSGGPSGVTIRNSLFSGGFSDGVRADANGVRIIGNEFRGLRDKDPFHTDPIQIYGGKRVVIRGNYFHDNEVSAAIMMADGGERNLVEHNVVAAGGQTWAMTWFSDDRSIIRHNTFADGKCDFGQRCGIINVGAKSVDPPGRGTVIRDNVLGGISNGGGDQDSGFVADHNLTAVTIPGKANITGLPTYAAPEGGYRGHALARGSLGVGDASDGSNLGVERGAVPRQRK